MPNYYIEQILPLGVLTGSRAFNCATESSDWEIVIHKSLLPDYTAAWNYQSTNFLKDDYDYQDGYKPGYNLDEYPEFEDEPFIEYDQSTIWGPLVQIIKYWYLTDPEDESTEVCINLFVYPDNLTDIYERFDKLNKLMNMCYGASLQDKQVRIEAFTKVIKLVGITDL